MSRFKLHEKSSLRLFCAYEKKGFKPFLTKILYVFYACIHGSWYWYFICKGAKECDLKLNKFSLGMFIQHEKLN
jgi:hypothetical protein